MPQQIQAPDGSIVEFPDGMSDDQISAAMRAEYGPKKTSQFQGFVEGVQQVGKNLEPALKVLPFSGPMMMTQGRQSMEMTDRWLEQQHEKGVRGGGLGKFAGSIVASAPTMFMGGPMTAGAIQGYATSGADDMSGKLMDTGIGAVGGKIGGYVVDKAADALAPVIAPAVRKLADAGVPLTPGQIKGGKAAIREDKAMSRPGIGEAIAADRTKGLDQWNRATIDRLILDPLGIKLPANVATGHDAVLFAQQTLDDAYNTLVPQMAVNLDRRFAAGLSKLAPAYQALGDAQQSQFNRVLESIRFGPGGSLAGQQLKTAQSELGRLSRLYGSSSAAGERELGRVIGTVKDELDGLMLRQNPALAPELAKTNKAYRGLAIVENAAKAADGGVFNTGQLKTAVRTSDKTTRKRATAAGQAHGQDWAEAGRQVLPSKYPDPGTAGRLMSASMPANVMGYSSLAGYRIGQKLAEQTLKKRPELAKRIGDVMRELSGPAGGLSAAALLQLTSQ